MNLTVDMGSVSYRATTATVRDALDLARAVHEALTGLGLQPWMELPGGVMCRDHGGVRAAERRES